MTLRVGIKNKLDSAINAVLKLKSTLFKKTTSLSKPNSFESFNNVQIDLNKDMKSLVYYDYLITDWSGIGIEYSILTNKKTIYLNTVKKKRKKLSFSEKKLVLIEDEIRKTAGIEIKLEKLNDINKYLDSDITISDNSYINSIKEPEFNSDKFEFLFK